MDGEGGIDGLPFCVCPCVVCLLRTPDWLFYARSMCCSVLLFSSGLPSPRPSLRLSNLTQWSWSSRKTLHEVISRCIRNGMGCVDDAWMDWIDGCGAVRCMTRWHFPSWYPALYQTRTWSLSAASSRLHTEYGAAAGAPPFFPSSLLRPMCLASPRPVWNGQWVVSRSCLALSILSTWD